MEHVYAALLVNESGAELNEQNLSEVLDAAGCDVGASRTKALVAALEGVDIPGDGGSTAPATGTGTEELTAAESDADTPSEGAHSR